MEKMGIEQDKTGTIIISFKKSDLHDEGIGKLGIEEGVVPSPFIKIKLKYKIQMLPQCESAPHPYIVCEEIFAPSNQKIKNPHRMVYRKYLECFAVTKASIGIVIGSFSDFVPLENIKSFFAKYNLDDPRNKEIAQAIEGSLILTDIFGNQILLIDPSTMKSFDIGVPYLQILYNIEAGNHAGSLSKTAPLSDIFRIAGIKEVFGILIKMDEHCLMVPE